MQFKATIIMAALLAFLGAYVVYYDIPETERKKKEKERSEKIIPFEKEDLEQIVLSHSETITLKKQDERWMITSPLMAEGDKRVIDGIASRLNSVTFSRIVDEEPKDLETYGLSKPELTVELTIKGETKKILLGNRTPLNNGIYVKRGEEKIVFLAGSYIKDDLKKTLYDLREKKIISFERDEVVEVTLKLPTGEFLLKKSEEEWDIEKPIKTSADDDALSDLLAKIKGLKVKEFIEETSADSSKYGLGETGRIELLIGPDKVEKVLLIGHKKEDGYYAKTTDAENIVLLPKDEIKAIIEQNLFSLRDKKIFDFETDTIDKINLYSSDEVIELVKSVKEEEEWRVVKPFSAKANEVAISRLVENIRQLTAKKFFKNEKKMKKGADGISFRRIVLQGNNKEFSLSVGELDQRENGYRSFSSSREIVFLLASAEVKDISKTLFDLRDRRILSFAEEKVNKIQIEWVGKSIVLEKKGKIWKLLSPEAGVAEELKIRIFLWNLRDIEFLEMVEGTKESKEEYGFSDPLVQVTIQEEDEEKTQGFIIGKMSDDKKTFYVKNTRLDTIYKIDTELLSKIVKQEMDF